MDSFQNEQASPHISAQVLSQSLDCVLGYLNFGSGQRDPKFIRGLDQLFEAVAIGKHGGHKPEAVTEPLSNHCESSFDNAMLGGKLVDRSTPTSDPNQADPNQADPIFKEVQSLLVCRLNRLNQENPTFQNVSQATHVLAVVFDQILERYAAHHQNLLYGKPLDFLFNSFFLARAFQVVLELISADDQSNLVQDTIARLNSFIGHRPIAMLESHRIEPYEHERVCPIPVFFSDVGVAYGPYQGLLQGTIEILRETDPDILRAAHFESRRLHELAIDPRTYDFDHPINRRPNHHFGQWDEDQIDGQGFFTRFILHQVVLDAILARIAEDSRELNQNELMREGSLLLAGTMLMGSGIVGSGPGAHDSNTTLSSLLGVIAGYRDQFYADWMDRLQTEHRKRLINEAKQRKQPLGAARQDLNSRLAQYRASQLVNCRLATIYARMGYAEAAERQSLVVPVASARINCQIDCLLDSATRAVAAGKLDKALQAIPRIMDSLKQGIDCGAIIDPWNILGFDANYSLFPALEDSTTDHRAFELIDLMERIFGICSQIWADAAASNQAEISQSIREEFFGIAQWWRQFAAHEVTSVDAVDAEEIFEAAELVASALELWQKEGAATGNIEFWAQHAEMFDSPKAYALVVEALLQRDDFVTSTALLIHWLSVSDMVPLQMADSSFHELVYQWINHQKKLILNLLRNSHEHQPHELTQELSKIWDRIRKFYDFLEANAEDYWRVPQFDYELKNIRQETQGYESEIDDDDDDDDDDDFSEFTEEEVFDELEGFADDDSDGEHHELFGAAYDEVVYQDSTDDGVDGELFGEPSWSDHELEAEIDRLLDRMEFIRTLANYWMTAATIPLPLNQSEHLDESTRERLLKRRQMLVPWIDQATDYRGRLWELMSTINRKFPLSATGSDFESLQQYDQLRSYKDVLLEHTIQTAVETIYATRLLLAAKQAIDYLVDQSPLESMATTGAEVRREELNRHDDPLIAVLAAIQLRDHDLVIQHFQVLINDLRHQSILYIPNQRGGDPAKIVQSKALKLSLLELCRQLPTVGKFTESHRMIETILSMEKNNPLGGGAITEFDELFEVAFRAMTQTLVEASKNVGNDSSSPAAKTELNDANPSSAHSAVTDQELSSTTDLFAIKQESERWLFNCTERLTESMLALWLEHSQTLRLSVLERLRDGASWQQMVQFIKTYGAGLFSQQFLYAGNMRAILHQGVENWLTQLAQTPNRPDLRLLDEIDQQISFYNACEFLQIIMEAVLENYNEYQDYNSTTTQSDSGDMLYTFLDFLRLKNRYERICWNLKPVVWAHSVLLNNGQNRVASLWRRSLRERIDHEADNYLEKLERLRKRYSIRMESVGRRIEGRLMHQLQIDRLCALVKDSMQEPQSVKSARKFHLLQQEAEAFIRSTNGVGVDLPAWLAALENEVDQHQLLQDVEQPLDYPLLDADQLSTHRLRDQLDALPGMRLFE